MEILLSSILGRMTPNLFTIAKILMESILISFGNYSGLRKMPSLKPWSLSLVTAECWSGLWRKALSLLISLNWKERPTLIRKTCSKVQQLTSQRKRREAWLSSKQVEWVLISHKNSRSLIMQRLRIAPFISAVCHILINTSKITTVIKGQSTG